VPFSVSTSTQLPDRLNFLTAASFAAVPMMRPLLPGVDRIFAGPRVTTKMVSTFGAAADGSGMAAF